MGQQRDSFIMGLMAYKDGLDIMERLAFIPCL